jgi:dephospho-CoA kinase
LVEVKPALLGLTGLYCAGKNYIAALLEKRGIPVLDVDRLGHAAIEREKAAIARRFGEDMLEVDGSVNRRLLGERVFGSPAELAALEGLVHPAANALAGEWIARQEETAARTGGPRFCVINAALLHRCASLNRIAAVIIVKAPFPLRLYRAWRRDRLSPAKLLVRFARQREFNAQYLAVNADIYIIANSGFAAGRSLEKRLDTILAEINTKIQGV